MNISFLKPEYGITSLDLLDIRAVFALPGVRALGSKKPELPKPDLNLSKWAPKCESATSHHYWMRSTIEEWLVACARVSKRVPIKHAPRHQPVG